MISVIIPTYNRAAFIADAVHSVMNQTRRDLEVIVADDGSTDETAEIVGRLGSSVTFVPLQHRGLPAIARNAGLRAARGELIAFLDSDDVYLSNKLELQATALEAQPDLGMVYSNARFFRENSSEPAGYVLDGLPSPSGHVFAELLRGNFLSTPIVLIRRSCLAAVGFFDERADFFAVEDYDLWLRIAAQYPVLFVPGEVAAIRRHSQSISRDVVVLRTRVLRVLEKMDALYPNLVRQYSSARHEAYARSYGAIALAEMQQGGVFSGFRHGLAALSHTLRMPGLGMKEFAAWWRRRRLRSASRP